MWNFESFTHQLGDAFEKVRKEVESLGKYDNDGNPSSVSQVDVAIDGGELLFGIEHDSQEQTNPQKKSNVQTEDKKESATVTHTTDLQHQKQEHPKKEQLVCLDLQFLEASERSSESDLVRVEMRIRQNEDSMALSETKTEITPSKLSVYSAPDPSKLQDLLSIREQQLHVQSQKLLQLQERNEFLERTSLSVSQEDYESLRYGYEERLKSAENTIYTLSRERDRLLIGCQDDVQKDEIIKEKNAIIEEVMAEGQKLSKKQLALENAIRKKTTRLKEVEQENEDLKEKLSAAVLTNDQLLLEKRQLAQTLQETEQHQKERLEVQRVQFEDLLKETSTAQAQADHAAKEAAKEGLLRRIHEAEDKNRTLSSHVEAMNSELEEQKKNAEETERRLKKETMVLEERCHEAEIRHEELLTKFPEATKPLLQQLELLQADMDVKTEAWTLAERAWIEQLETAEETIQTMKLKEQALQHRMQELANENKALGTKCDDLKERLTAAVHEQEEIQADLMQSKGMLEEKANALEKQRAEWETLKSSQQEMLEKLESDYSVERTAKLTIERELRQLQIAHQKLSADFDDVKKSASTIQLDQRHSAVDEISIASETTDRDTETASTRNAFGSKQHQIDRLQKQINSLENTREHLSAELVAITQRALKAESSLTDFENIKQQLNDLQGRYASAIELLGEREEQVEELKADLEDFKQMYRDQIAYVAEQLSGAKS